MRVSIELKLSIGKKIDLFDLYKEALKWKS